MISTQVKPILRLRASLAVGYHRLGQPMPFVYVHLVRILTTCYLPVFAFVLARLGSRNPAVHTCVEIKILRRVRAEPSRRPPRHRRDACSMAWRCRFVTARSHHGRVVAEK